MYNYFVSLGKFIPRYLILFVEMVSGIYFLVSLSDFSLLFYSNAIGSCVLIFVSYNFAEVISSSNFLILLLRVFYVQYHVICK